MRSLTDTLVPFEFCIKGSGTILIDTKTPPEEARLEIRKALAGGIDHAQCNIFGMFNANITHLDLMVPHWKQEAAP